MSRLLLPCAKRRWDRAETGDLFGQMKFVAGRNDESIGEERSEHALGSVRVIGKAHDVPRRFCPKRTSPQTRHELSSPLSIRPDKFGLRNADAGRANGWVRAGPGPGANTTNRTLRTPRSPLLANLRAEVEQRLVPFPTLPDGHHHVGDQLCVSWLQRSTAYSSEHPPNICVENPNVIFERERQNCSCSVRADSGQGEQLVELVRDVAVMVCRYFRRAVMKHERSTVVAQSVPH